MTKPKDLLKREVDSIVFGGHIAPGEVLSQEVKEGNVVSLKTAEYQIKSRIAQIDGAKIKGIIIEVDSENQDFDNWHFSEDDEIEFEEENIFTCSKDYI